MLRNIHRKNKLISFTRGWYAIIIVGVHFMVLSTGEVKVIYGNNWHWINLEKVDVKTNISKCLTRKRDTLPNVNKDNVLNELS